nr:uncharacterized protein LOC101447259 [Dasypus novemcinctus]
MVDTDYSYFTSKSLQTCLKNFVARYRHTSVIAIDPIPCTRRWLFFSTLSKSYEDGPCLCSFVEGCSHCCRVAQQQAAAATSGTSDFLRGDCFSRREFVFFYREESGNATKCWLRPDSTRVVSGLAVESWVSGDLEQCSSRKGGGNVRSPATGRTDVSELQGTWKEDLCWLLEIAVMSQIVNQNGKTKNYKQRMMSHHKRQLEKKL